MTSKKTVSFKQPVLRVNNRQRNIDFYEMNLGMKRLREENALTIFTAYANRTASFTIEESPGTRTRAVEGVHKLQEMVIKLSSEDIEALLARHIQVDKVLKGKYFAFEATSPEGAKFLVHAEEDNQALQEVPYPDLTAKEDFEGVADFTVESITLAVPHPDVAKAFYQETLSGILPLPIYFVKGEGPDLQVNPETTWDLEILEYQVAEDYDLVALRDRLETSGLEVYLDAKARMLVVSDTSNIEIWICK